MTLSSRAEDVPRPSFFLNQDFAMNQTNLDRAVARATGETVERVQRMGFSLMVMPRFVPPPVKQRRRIAAPRLATSRR
jgi:hypothetical protein